MKALRLAALAAAWVLASSCGNGSDPAPPPQDVQHWISPVGLPAVGVGEEPIAYPDTVFGVLRTGKIPPESQGPPVAISTVYAEVGTGQSLVYDFGSYARDNLTKFYVWVGEGTGYWEVTLPESAGSIAYGVGLKVTITYSDSASAGSFHLRVAGTDTLGKTGATADQRNVMFVSDTGVQVPDVSAVLRWTGGSDLDLHVIDPFGHDLSPFIPTTPEGGVLEDASGACVSDTTSHERAFWPKGKAPAGEYRVIVVYYADCGEPATVPFTLTLKTKGGEDQDLTGSFEGVAAGAAPDTVATFRIR